MRSRLRGLRWSCYSCVSGLNRRHQLFAWFSLFSVGFADLYVRLCSMGIWTTSGFCDVHPSQNEPLEPCRTS